MDYPGKVIRKTPVTPTQTSASGVWTVDDALQAVKTNTWPIAGVPNPISRSLRFNSADSAYLNRTPTTAGNRRTWTWSAWVKRSAIGTGTYEVFRGDASTGGTSLFTGIRFIDDQLYIQDANTASYNIWWVTTAVFRDPSAWYHFVVKYDTTQASSSNAVSLWVNGVSQTLTFTPASGSYSQNRDSYINATNAQYFGVGLTSAGALSTNYFPGYMTEINFVDGQALTPSDFGLTDPQTGAWIPKKYTGTYGTNGFYVNFKDNSSTGTLGYDYSGNSNNWTANNFSVTAGAGNDSLVDVPTQWIGYNTSGDTGGIWRGNYCTLNPNRNTTSTQGTFSNGNLQIAGTNGVNNCYAAGTMAFAGKMYCEITITAAGGDTTTQGVGIVPITSNQFAVANSMSTGIYYIINGNKRVTGTSSSYGSSYTTGDIIGIAVDVDAETVTFYKNNVSQGSISGTGVISAGVVAYIGFQDGGSPSITVNFGQRPFAYTPPAGFVSLCTTNLPTPTIGATSTTQAGKYFNPVLYTGTGSSLGVTGVGFQPDFVWIKERSEARSHALFDVLRGATIRLYSDSNVGDQTETTTLTAFNTDGFTVSTSVAVNNSAQTYASWNWKAGGTGVSNTAGSITSTVSANTAAGFSIVTYTGNATAGATVGHGCQVNGVATAPSMIIVKNRVATSGAREWVVYHSSLGNTQAVFLNTTGSAYTGTNLWNNTSPTSTVFTVGNSSEGTNGSGDAMLAYCFASIAGYSAFGSYTGNGSSDGPFVYTGFKPAYVMIKYSSGTADWIVLDKSRPGYNVIGGNLYPNGSYAEDTQTKLDFTSNGFKIRADGTNANVNVSSGTYIYAAFAEFPFKFSNAR